MGTDQKNKPKPIDPESPRWEKLANQMARDFAPQIIACKHCRYPVVEGYCCRYCGSSDPR